MVLTNTIWGAAIDIEDATPVLSLGRGGYSGPPLKPIALRCVMEVSAALPGLPIIGSGGVTTGADAIEYLMAGASAVQIGTAHFAQPRAAARILREVDRWCRRRSVQRLTELVGAVRR